LLSWKKATSIQTGVFAISMARTKIQMIGPGGLPSKHRQIIGKIIAVGWYLFGGAIVGVFCGAAFNIAFVAMAAGIICGGVFLGLSQYNSRLGRICNDMYLTLWHRYHIANHWSPPSGHVLFFGLIGAIAGGCITAFFVLLNSPFWVEFPKSVYKAPLNLIVGVYLGIIVFAYRKAISSRLDIQFDSKGDQLVDAAKKGDAHKLQELLAEGVNVNVKGREFDLTALMVAASKGHIEIVRILLAHNADINKREKINDCTALMIAAQEGQAEVLRVLLAKGSKVNATNAHGLSALVFAAAHDQAEIIKILLAEGADVNNKSVNDRTPLMTAAQAGHIEIVKILLVNGTDVNAKNTKGQTALMLATERRRTEIVKLLKRYTNNGSSAS
jgi:ankyrin repeat protein